MFDSGLTVDIQSKKMATLGQELKNEREMRGISLKEIADTTKIDLRFLRAIEEDRMDMLPGKFFTKGILRAFAEYLGMEEHDILNRFYLEEQLREQLQEEKSAAPNNQPAVPRKIKSILAFFGIVVVLISILFALYLILHKNEAPMPEEKIFPTTIPQNHEIVPEAIEPMILAKQQKLNLAITFQKLTWIQIFTDGIIALDGNQEPGFVFQTRAEKELLIHCGNLGGFTYSLNNRKGKKLGKIGAVQRNIRITLENINQFLD